MYDIIIIGAGPAGLTSALYALRAKKSVLILEAKSYGGQIINALKIENYPGIKEVSGYQYATNLYNQVKDLGAIIKYEPVLKIDAKKVVYTSKNKYHGASIIIATGLERRKLNLANEEKFLGKGISYCATCDGNFYKNASVAVVGGGSTALEDALYLADIAKNVYLIHRKENFRGENLYLQELKQKTNVEFILNSTIKSLNGEDALESITIINEEKRETTLQVSGLFVAIGLVPNNTIFANVVALDDAGFIISKDGVHTKTKDIYVAGDARQKDIRQLTTAVSDGTIAAMTAIKEMAK